MIFKMVILKMIKGEVRWSMPTCPCVDLFQNKLPQPSVSICPSACPSIVKVSQLFYVFYLLPLRSRLPLHTLCRGCDSPSLKTLNRTVL